VVGIARIALLGSCDGEVPGCDQHGKPTGINNHYGRSYSEEHLADLGNGQLNGE
jgi:hypothetical protein